MTGYQIHTVDTVSEDARQPLVVLREAFGFVPNGAGLMANSPALLNTFFSAFGHFRGGGTFGPDERQVLLLSKWAVAFHSLEALADGVEPVAVDALRRGELPADPRLAALSAVTRALIEKRGHLDDADVEAFMAAGFTVGQLFEVITGVAISSMTNLTANIARPPLDAAVRPHVWTAGYLSGV
jgi:hypothetical protein